MDMKNPNPVIRNAKKHFSQEQLNGLEDAVRTEVSIPNGYLTLTEAKKLIEQARYAEQLEIDFKAKTPGIVEPPASSEKETQ